MATRISLGGNFNTAGSWAVVDTTSLLDSEAGNTELTTSYVESAGFIPGAITIDGIAVKLASRAASPTGTVSVRLALSGATVTGTEVTINATDLPTCGTTTNEGGWILFKFAAPVLLVAATTYTVSAKESVATADVFLYRNATAGNWSRMLRTTTTGAPAATDQLDIMGEHTGAGTGNNITITMDNTAATDFGSGTDGAVAITVCKRGTLNYAYAAATNYYLKCSGNVIVYNGGTMTIGTVANPIPRGGTAVLEFDPVADGGMGLLVRNGATFTAQGLSRTIGKNVVSCKLNTNEAINQTELGVDTDTGWLDNDAIAVASTTRTYSQCENGTLNGAAAAAVLTVDGFGGAGGGLAYAHSGTSPTQAEVILLTRNVKISSTSSTIMAYCYFATTATVNIDWVEFYYLGENAATRRGVEADTTTGSCDMQYSSFHDCEDWGFYAANSASANITWSYNVMYNCDTAGSAAIYASAYFVTSSASSNVASNDIILKSAYDGIRWYCLRGSISYITGSSCTNDGIVIGSTSNSPFGSVDYLTAHSNNAAGINLQFYGDEGTISNIITWRNNTHGIQTGSGERRNMIFDTITAFGNTIRNINLGNTHNSIFNNLVLDGEAAYATVSGIGGSWSASSICDIKIYDSTFGATTAHSTNDIILNADSYSTIELINCLLTASTEVSIPTTAMPGSYVKSSKHDQTAGKFKSWFKYGTVGTDTAIFNTASPSMKLTPNSASYKLESGSFKVNVNSGQTCTPSVFVRESVIGDGTDYNGNRIRLVLKRNDAIGITADTVLDTATVASEGAFEEIGAVTPVATDDGVMEFVIDCDGTTGWINVDDFSATVA
jgi:hypothetical protein